METSHEPVGRCSYSLCLLLQNVGDGLRCAQFPLSMHYGHQRLISRELSASNRVACTVSLYAQHQLEHAQWAAVAPKGPQDCGQCWFSALIGRCCDTTQEEEALMNSCSTRRVGSAVQTMEYIVIIFLIILIYRTEFSYVDKPTICQSNYIKQ